MTASFKTRFGTRALAATVGAFVLALAGCAVDVPTAPARPAPEAASPALALPLPIVPRLPVVNGILTNALVRTVPIARDTTVTVVIGATGGEFVVPGGLRVRVPAGAVTEPTTFTATALAGDLVAYEFGPHGTRFTVPLEFTQELRGTNATPLLSSLLPPRAGYFADRSSLDYNKKTATVLELLPVRLLLDLGVLRFDVWHFSGYMLAWG